MKRTRHTPEQVIRKLRDAERMLAEGKDPAGSNVLDRALANRQDEIGDLVAWAGANDACIVVDQPSGGAALLIARPGIGSTIVL